MKLKKLHILSTVLVGGLAMSVLSSYSGGNNLTGRSSTGCGTSGCHNAAKDAATVISLTGLPSNGWVPGTAYTMTLTVTNAAKVAAGFDLNVSIGTLTAGAGTMAMGTELHHTGPKSMTSGTASWTFTWTAPATRGRLVVDIAGNAVNLNSTNDAGDVWNNISLSFDAANAASIANTFSEAGYAIYPNPVKDQLTLTAKAGADVTISAASINGNRIALRAAKIAADKYQVNTANLAAGAYVLLLQADGKTYSTRFVKQ